MSVSKHRAKPDPDAALLIERLASKWRPVVQYGNEWCGGLTQAEERADTEEDARWWLDAIATEIEAMWEAGVAPFYDADEVVKWLRSMVGER